MVGLIGLVELFDMMFMLCGFVMWIGWVVGLSNCALWIDLVECDNMLEKHNFKII